MNKYEGLIDVSYTWEDDDIEVIGVVAEGKDAEDAYNNLIEQIEKGYYEDEIGDREYYVWEITEEDILED